MNFVVYKNSSQGDFLQFYKGLDEGHVSIQGVDGTVLAESDSHFFEYELDNNVSSVVVFADDVYQYRRSKTSDREAHQLDVVISVIDAYLAEVKKKIDDYAKNSYEDLTVDDLEKVLFPVYDRNSTKFELAKLNIQKILGDAVDSQAGSYSEAVEQIINVVDKLSKIVLDFSSLSFFSAHVPLSNEMAVTDSSGKGVFNLKEQTFADWLRASFLPAIPVGGRIVVIGDGVDRNSIFHTFFFKIPVDGTYLFTFPKSSYCYFNVLSGNISNKIFSSFDSLKNYVGEHINDADVYGVPFFCDNVVMWSASGYYFGSFKAGDLVQFMIDKSGNASNASSGSGNDTEAALSAYSSGSAPVIVERFV